MEWFYQGSARGAKVAFNLLARWEVSGRENVPKEGPVIVAANHTSYLDPPLLMASVGRRIRFLAHMGLFHHPLFGLLARGINTLPVDREAGSSAITRKVLRDLDKGSAIGLFPEGTRSLNGDLGKGKSGIAYIALKSGACVLPVGIAGTHRIRTVTDALKRPAVGIRIGQPFLLPQPKNRPQKEQIESFANDIMERIATLLPKEQRGLYPGQPEIHTEMTGEVQ